MRSLRTSGWRAGVVTGGLAVVLAGIGLVTATNARAAAGCRVAYTTPSQWPGGFTAGVTVTNLGDAINGWRLVWAAPSGLQILQAWNATVTASGSQITATNASYNAGIATNGTVSFGFNATSTGAGTTPAAFALNGVACTGAVGAPSPSPSSPSPSPSSPSPSPSTPPPASPSTSPSVPAGRELVVAPNGNDAGPGTVDSPLASIQRAIDLAQPGTTISLRAGTYTPTTNYQITRSGTAAAPITLQSYRGEAVVLDGEQLPNTPAPLNGSLPNAERGVIHIEQASHWRVIGLQIANGPYGLYCRDCGNNTFDRLVTRNNYESGLQIQGASGGNQVLNLDSYGNRDPRKNGESADGLAIKEGSGAGNVVRGARLWNNVDDGFDAWEFLSPITIESSVAWGNGVNRWGFPDFAGDGNGFKLGGGDEDLPAGHIVRNSIAFDNAQGGFIDNANPGALVIERSTAWRNGGTGFDFADSQATLTKNLSTGNRTQVSLGSSTGTGNSWNLGGTWTLVSTDPSVLTGARTAAGAIASSSFLRPANGADVGARF